MDCCPTCGGQGIVPRSKDRQHHTDDWALTAGAPAATLRRVIADVAAARIDRGHLATVVRDAILNNLWR
jgi:hypothetical protein